MVAHAKKSVVARMVRGVADNKLPLRVLGSQKEGFRLAVQDGEKIVPFGYPFEKQTEAVTFGERKFGVKAKKVVKTA